jgi:hypothetical protein
MRLGGKIYYRPRFVFDEQLIYRTSITYVTSHKDMVRIILQVLKIRKITRVGQLIEIDYHLTSASEPKMNKIAADEPGSAGN